MDIYVYSREMMRIREPDDVKHIVISITTDGVPAKFKMNELTAGVLRLVFPDLDRPTDLWPEETLFSDEHARTILDFVAKHSDCRVIVHCDAGRSRSPGVAAALAKIYNGDDSEFYRRYTPNRRIFRKILDASV